MKIEGEEAINNFCPQHTAQTNTFKIRFTSNQFKLFELQVITLLYTLNTLYNIPFIKDLLGRK